MKVATMAAILAMAALLFFAFGCAGLNLPNGGTPPAQNVTPTGVNPPTPPSDIPPPPPDSGMPPAAPVGGDAPPPAPI